MSAQGDRLADACRDEATSLFILSAIENEVGELTEAEDCLVQAAIQAGIAGTFLALQGAGLLPGEER